MQKRAVILDRDGTIIIDKVYLNEVAGIEYLPNAFEGLRKMRDLGYTLVVATNQSGVARGIVSIEVLYQIHDKMRADLAAEGINIEAFYYAPHSVESNHFTRKPNPGMLLQAAKDFDFDLKSSFMIGDRETDVFAGRAAGTRTIFLDHTFPHTPAIGADFVCNDLVQASDFISKF